MNTNVEALKAIYVALGGSLTDTYSDIANNIAVSNYVLSPDCLMAISKKVSSIGIELPTVSAVDDGDVLTVVSGKWAKASVPKELPAVTAEDDGSVLKVVDGAWGVGTDNIMA